MVFLRRLFFILIFVLWTSSAFGALVPAIEVDSIDFDGDATKTTVAVGEEVLAMEDDIILARLQVYPNIL